MLWPIFRLERRLRMLDKFVKALEPINADECDTLAGVFELFGKLARATAADAEGKS